MARRNKKLIAEIARVVPHKPYKINPLKVRSVNWLLFAIQV